MTTRIDHDDLGRQVQPGRWQHQPRRGGPYFNFSTPEPTGVVGIIAPERPSLLGIVSAIVPVITTGTTAVVIASEDHPLPAISLGEVLATSATPPNSHPGWPPIATSTPST